MPLAEREISYLSQDQIKNFLYTLSKSTVRNRALFTVAYWRGLRASEVGLMQVGDWKEDSGRLYVRRLKGSNSGEYKVSPAEVTALRTWIKIRGLSAGPMFPSTRGGPISRQRLHNLMKELCLTAGIGPPVNHCHVLRHSIAVHLAEKGVDVAVIQDWLGHRDISSTMVYVRITNVARDRAADFMYSTIEPTGHNLEPKVPQSSRPRFKTK